MTIQSKRVTDELVQIKLVNCIDDCSFVQHCIDSEDFHVYIDDISVPIEKYKIFVYKKKYVGIFFEKYCGDFGVDMFMPNIYIRYKKYSAICITAMIQWLGNNYKWEKILFKVYDNNKQCLLIMKKLRIFLEGKIKNTGVSNGTYTYFFSVLPEEIEEIRKSIKKLIGEI